MRGKGEVIRGREMDKKEKRRKGKGEWEKREGERKKREGNRKNREGERGKGNRKESR